MYRKELMMINTVLYELLYTLQKILSLFLIGGTTFLVSISHRFIMGITPKMTFQNWGFGTITHTLKKMIY